MGSFPRIGYPSLRGNNSSRRCCRSVKVFRRVYPNDVGLGFGVWENLRQSRSRKKLPHNRWGNFAPKDCIQRLIRLCLKSLLLLTFFGGWGVWNCLKWFVGPVRSSSQSPFLISTILDPFRLDFGCRFGKYRSDLGHGVVLVSTEMTWDMGSFW